jgi:RNA polymerase sigma factor (sigma-70 family)
MRRRNPGDRGNHGNHDHRMNGGDGVVERFLRFQATGADFDVAWEGVGPIVEECARGALRKLRVQVWTGYGGWAVDDVGSATKLRLFELGQPGAKGHFDPAKTKVGGLGGFRGWLWRVVYRQAVDWARDNCNVGDRKLFLQSDLEWNDPSGDDEPESILKRVPARVERVEILPILEEAIGHLADPLMRQAVLLKLHEGLSEAATGHRLGVSDTTIHRRLQAAYAILRPLLENRGFDDKWLAA